MSSGPLYAYRRAASPDPAPAAPIADTGAGGDGVPSRPWIGVQFLCAGKYVRVYRRGDGAGYLARCPSCGKSMWFRVGQGGTGERFFELSCR